MNVRTASVGTGNPIAEFAFPNCETNKWHSSETSLVDLSTAAKVDQEYAGKEPETFLLFPTQYAKLDTLYRFLKYLPRDKCRYSHFMHKGADITSFSTKLDGVLSTSDLLDFGPNEGNKEEGWKINSNGEVRYELDHMNVIPISNGCIIEEQSELSEGAITGIIIVCVVAVGAIATAMMRVRHKN